MNRDRSAAMQDELFRIFEDRMSAICSVVPSNHSKSIVNEEWFSYVDSLSPAVESIRPTMSMIGKHITIRKTGNIPVVALLMERINEGRFDGFVIEDPGVSREYIPAWGPNLLLVDREFALRVVALGELP